METFFRWIQDVDPLIWFRVAKICLVWTLIGPGPHPAGATVDHQSALLGRCPEPETHCVIVAPARDSFNLTLVVAKGAAQVRFIESV